MARVGFSKDGSLPSRIIRRLTGAPCSHAFLILEKGESEFGREMVLEASAFGIRLVSLERFKSQNEVVCEVDFKGHLSQGLVAAGSWLGEVYDFGGLFGMAFVILGRWLKKKWRNPLHRAHSLFCSELVTEVLQDSGIDGVSDLVPEDTSPGDLMDALMKRFLV